MKTDIALITLHRVLNYGSVLQTFASLRALDSLGYRAYAIDYTTRMHRLLTVVFSSKSQHNWLLRTGLALAILPRFAISRWRFDRFLHRYVTLSPRSYDSLNALRANPPQAAVYLTGSDQVWNSVYNSGIDPAFFLDFGPPETARIAYAASFGRDSLTDAERAPTAALLHCYSALGMRESSGVRIATELGGRVIEHVLDPTLLLPRASWLPMIEASTLPRSPAPYVLVHSVNKECLDPLNRYARKVGASAGMAVRSTVAGDANLRGRLRATLIGWHRPTEDFLALIDRAGVVITDSFHGTVFSILFNKRFVVILPPKYGTRLISLLELLGLSERIISEHAPASAALAPIDHEVVAARLAQERALSLRFLKRAIVAATGPSDAADQQQPSECACARAAP